MSSQTMSNAQETAQHKPLRHEIYEAAANGDTEFFKAHELEICNFESHTKNTVLHIYIIAQSKGRDDHRAFGLATSPSAVFENCKQMIYCACESSEQRAARLSAQAGDTVRAILKIFPALLEKANEAEDTPLHMAARHGQAEIVKVLIDRAKSLEKDIEKGGRVQTMLHMVNADKETALHQAVRYQHTAVAKILIAEDDSKFVYSPNKDGETPLYLAVERSNGAIVNKIVNYYTSPAYEGPDGRTALHVATRRFFLEMKMLVKKPKLAFLTTKRDDLGRTPLHYGSSMLELDNSAAFIADNEGKLPIHILAEKGYSKSVRDFITKCPECFEMVDKSGRNALHYAVESGDKDTVDAILKDKHLGDLLKKKDYDGITPLHLLATSRIYMPNLIKDPRYDKMAFNAEGFNPLDIIINNPTTRIEMELENSMREAGIKPGMRLKKPKTKTNIVDHEMDNKKGKETDKIIHKNTNDQSSGGGDDDLKEERQNHLVVAALIATVTFAAGFTLPGGYNQQGPDVGYAVFTQKTAFQAFVITNTLAMVLSCTAVFIHLLIAMNREKENRSEVKSKEKQQTRKEKMVAKLKEKIKILKLFNKALPITLMALIAMVIAFITGSYSVLSHAPLLAIAVSVTGCVFFGMFWYLWEELFSASKTVLAEMVIVAVALICLILTLITAPIIFICSCLYTVIT